MGRELYAYKCRKCGEMHYPFRMVCKGCGDNDFFEFDTVALPKKGKILTYTFVHTLPADFEVAKLGLAIVELENGIRVTGQIEITDPRIGMAVVGRVEEVRREAYDSRFGLVFRKA
ncbi:MAG: OB-fold domain-containing protein [Candidatus Eisenbacteria bacterium]|nr:OB-fold domain-containing protein [Candidatus Eisenbacteria bacterium]